MSTSATAARGRIACRWDRGDGYPGLLQHLKQEGFSGAVLQELYRESYRQQSEVLEGYRRLQRQIDAVWER